MCDDVARAMLPHPKVKAVRVTMIRQDGKPVEFQGYVRAFAADSNPKFYAPPPAGGGGANPHEVNSTRLHMAA